MRVTKIWSSGVVYSDVNNWSPKRIPCSRDRIIFPERSVVYIDVAVKAREVIFPMNGQLVIGDNSGFDLKEESMSDTCKGQDMKFIAETKNWYDPRNWNQTMVDESDNFVKQFSGRSKRNPMPHSDRIPCFYDNVMFPSAASFKIDLPLIENTNVKSLVIDGEKYDTNSFDRLLNTDVGKYLFQSYDNKLLIDSSKGTCADPSGCSCNNIRDDIMSKICSFEKPRCETPACSDPITPVGHCCPICGVIIKLKHKNNGFRYELLEGFLNAYPDKKEAYKGVLTYLSKLKDRNLQIVLIDDESQTGNALKMGNRLVEYLKEGNLFLLNLRLIENLCLPDSQSDQPQVYAIENIEIIYSDNSRSRFGVGFVFLTLFLLALLAGVAFAVYYLYTRKSLLTSNSFTFVRFGGVDSDDRIELTLGKTDEVNENGSQSLSKKPVMLSSEASLFTLDEDKVSFENPLFGKSEIEDEVTTKSGPISPNNEDLLIDVPISDKKLEE